MSKKDIKETILGKWWQKSSAKSFLDALKEALKNAFTLQERIATATSKTVGKALATFDEVNTLKMPSTGSGTTVQQTGSSVNNLVGTAMSALIAMTGKLSQISSFAKMLAKLPGLLLSLISPGQQSISIFERITGIFRQTEITADAVGQKTQAVALAVGRLSGAWSGASFAMQQWQQTGRAMENTAPMIQNLGELTKNVKLLGGGFQDCKRAADQTLKSIQTNWANLNQWFRTNVANPMIRDVNNMLKGITNGFNQVAYSTKNVSTGAPISTPKIPQLAQGAVLPANKPFLAVVGDQKNGTNVEAPLDTIRQAVAEVVGSNDVVIQFNGDLAQLARVLRPAIIKENARVGGGLIVKEVL